MTNDTITYDIVVLAGSRKDRAREWARRHMVGLTALIVAVLALARRLADALC